MGSEQGRTVPDRATLVRALGTLKREGSNVLVVGREQGAHASICRRLSGESDRPRYRLFVTTNHSRGPFEHGLDGGVDWVVAYSSEEVDHDAVAADVSVDELSALGSELLRVVDGVDAESTDLGPADLRLCVDSLAPLLAEYDAERVFRFLHVVTSRVRRANGMGHYHLPIERDHDDVRLLEPLFDALLEVRTRDGRVEQRVHLEERDASSQWLSL